jgi:hypothetical protein
MKYDCKWIEYIVEKVYIWSWRQETGSSRRRRPKTEAVDVELFLSVYVCILPGNTL